MPSIVRLLPFFVSRDCPDLQAFRQEGQRVLQPSRGDQGTKKTKVERKTGKLWAQKTESDGPHQYPTNTPQLELENPTSLKRSLNDRPPYLRPAPRTTPP